MSEMIEALKEEHSSMRNLLDLIEREVKRPDQPDYGLLHEVMAYCRTYPDQFHHPKEDLIYRAICRHDPRATPAIEDLEAEHEELAIASQEFADLVEQGLATGTRPPGFNEIGLAFVAQYRQHIVKEDREFFPSAVEILSPEEWRELSEQINHPGDPLFYQTAADRLQALLARKFDKAG